MLLAVEHLINLYCDMDSEYEDYNLDKLLEELNSNIVSSSCYKVFRACEEDENVLKDFITMNLNLPMYNKFDKYYAEVVGYTNNNDNTPLAIIGITKDSKVNNISIWNTFTESDIIIAKDLDKFMGYRYITLYDIICAINDKNHPFILDF